MLRKANRESFHVRGTGPDAAVGVSEMRNDVLAETGRAGDQLGGAGRCDGVQAVIYKLLFARAVQHMNRAYICTSYCWLYPLPHGFDHGSVNISIRRLVVFECLN